MKRLILSLALLACAPAFGAGKLILQNNFPDGGKQYRPAFGLSIYEPIVKDLLALNLWAGYGREWMEQESDVDWIVSKAQVDISYKKFVVSPGARYRFLPGEDKGSDVYGYVRLSYQLW